MEEKGNWTQVREAIHQVRLWIVLDHIVAVAAAVVYISSSIITDVIVDVHPAALVPTTIISFVPIHGLSRKPTGLLTSADDIDDTKNNHSHNSTCNNNSSNDNNNKHNDGTKGGGVEGGIQDRIQMIKNMNRLDDDINFVDKEGTHMIVQTDGMMEEFAPISRALYAESVKNGEYNSVYVFVSYLPWRMSCCSFCT